MNPWASEFLKGLNDSQSEAVVHGEGPLLIIAGPGSGKTRVLTHRLAYLLAAHDVHPSQVLAVTFTNKAAAEMRRRVEQLIGPAAEQVWVGTFHSTCVQLLRREAHHAGYERNFTIFDTADQLLVIRDILKELNLDPKQHEPRAILGSISHAKNELISAAEYDEQASDYWEQIVAKMYKRYQERLCQNKAFDFDDLIVVTVELFQSVPSVLERYQERFRYVLVDEYQDTNRAQYRLINLIAGKSRNLTIVGDESQSIYRFRGADISNILNFTRDYPDARVVKLEENYRSTQTILQAANALIENNIDRLEKKLWTKNPKGEPILLYRGEDERAEAAFVAAAISRGIRDEGRNYGEFTILYRTHAQSRTFEEEFMRRGIPYKIVSGLRFYERKEIKDLLAYLRLVYNPSDSYSFVRVVNVPKRGIGDVTVTRLLEYAEQHGISAYDAIAQAAETGRISGAAGRRLLEFKELVDGLIPLKEKLSPSALVSRVLDASGYLQELHSERSIEAEGRIENLKEFISVAQQFEKEHPEGDLATFLEHVALVSDADNYDEGAEVVSMMSLHAAKGLEFPIVLMVGMEEGIFPHSRAAFGEPGEMEEERRLCYVGITRAKERLVLTCTHWRTLYGSSSQTVMSRFLKEIPEELIRNLEEERRSLYGVSRQDAGGWGRTGATSYSGGLDSPSRDRGSPAGEARTGDARGWRLGVGRREETENLSTGISIEALKQGDRVRHAVWGEGTVEGIRPAGRDAVISIRFPDLGVKTVMASMAPLAKV